jgi:hypothetical protein
METSLDLGIVGFDAPPGWNFFPMRDRVIARPENRVGVLTISVAERTAVTGTPSHEICMVAAKQAAGLADEGPGADRARDHLDSCLAGGESFSTAADLMRVWYHYCPATGLIVAWFSAPRFRAQEPLVKDLIKDCERIVLSLHLPSPLS